MQRAHSLLESIERRDRLAALLLRHVLDERDDRFHRGGAVRLEIAMADDAFFRMHVGQDERKILEFTQLGDNRAAQRRWTTRTTTLSSVSRTAGVGFIY